MKFKIRLEEILIVIILIFIIQGAFFVNATYGQSTYLSSQQFENQSAFSKNNSKISSQNIVDPAQNNDSNSLPKHFNSNLGTEAKNRDNWITVNHDIYGTRKSNQTTINAENVANLKIKWRLFSDAEISDPPIIISYTGYVQDSSGTVIAFDTRTGETLWKAHVGSGPTMGLTFNDGIVFAATAYNATVVALNATNGRIIWQSQHLGNPKIGYNIPSQPIVWKDYVIAGSAAGGDNPNGVTLVQGNITALNITNGKIIWNIRTTAGEWVKPGNAPAYNGDASDWSGGSLDPETGIMYIPLGSPSPSFNATTRQTPNLYSNHMIAVNVTSGQIIWATPFIDYGTILNVRVPDTHDWDTSWGSSISKVTFDNGTQRKIVIGHDKMGNIVAMDAATGKVIWWKIFGKQYNTDTIPLSTGSGMVWSYGIFNFHAIDNNNNSLYVSATNRGLNYFTDSYGNDGGIRVAGHTVPAPHTIERGLSNGTIVAMDLRTGKVRWQYPTEFPPRVSPLVTDGVLFAGYIPFTEKAKGNHTTTTKSGVILALDKDTGKKLWEHNVNAPIGHVGPSIGNGMLFVPTGEIQGQTKGTPKEGSIVAFGLS